MQPRRARSIRPSTVGWLALIIGTTLSACVLFAFAAVIFGADCGRSLGSTVCSDEVRPRLAQSATMLSAVFLAIGSAIAVAALATILVGKHRNKLPHISVGAVGLGITSAVVVMFSLGVLVAPGDQPRLHRECRIPGDGPHRCRPEGTPRLLSRRARSLESAP